MTIRRLPNIEWPRNFKDWKGLTTIRTFGLTEAPEHPDFLSWTSASHPIPAEYGLMIEGLRQKLQRYWGIWNEAELMMHFVSPLFHLIDFQSRYSKLYCGRKLYATIEGHRVGGTVDCVLAFGLGNPLQPFFYLKQYQKRQGKDGDPFGQLLITMLAAQHSFDLREPLYGCFFIANQWEFVMLDGHRLSRASIGDASYGPKLERIWSMLVEVKRIVEERVAQLMAETD